MSLDKNGVARIEAAASLPAGLTIVDGVEMPDDPWSRALAEALADVKAKLEAAPAKHRPRAFGIDAVDLLGQTFEAARWIVTGIMQPGSVGAIVGEPKTCKTWLALELAVSIATGTKVCGEFYAQHGVAADFFAEDIGVQIRNRLRAELAGANRTLERGRLTLRPRGEFIDLLRDEDLAWIVATARKLGQLDLLVLDPLRDINSGEEDKSDSMRDVMRRLRVLAELLGCAVWIVHHAKKIDPKNAKSRVGTLLRGSSAVFGALDALVFLHETDKGDGVTHFVNAMTVITRGGRSAGSGTLEMRVTDNEDGEAVETRWSFSREQSAPRASSDSARTDRDVGDDDALFACIGANPGMTITQLRNGKAKEIHAVPYQRAIAAVNRLLTRCKVRCTGAGYFVQDGASANP